MQLIFSEFFIGRKSEIGQVIRLHFRAVFLIIVIGILNNFGPVSTKHYDSKYYSNILSSPSRSPKPPILPKPLQHEHTTTLPSQELYYRENTWRSSLIEEDDLITQQPTLGKDPETFLEYPETKNEGDDIQSSNKERTARRKRYGLKISTKNSLDVQKDVIVKGSWTKYYFSSIVNHIKQLIIDSFENASELYRPNSNYSDNDHEDIQSVFCKDNDPYFNYECLKEKLIRYIKHIMSQRSLKLFNIIQLDLDPKAEMSTDTLQRSFSSELWNNIVTFFRTRVLRVSLPDISYGLLPSLTTTVRFLQGEDNNRRLELGLEFPDDTHSEEAVEGRGKKKKKGFKKGIAIAIMMKAAVVAKAVLAKVVLLAKKALLISIGALVVSVITAKKQKKKKSSGKGDHNHRRFGAFNYFDLKNRNPKYDDVHVDTPHYTEPWVNYSYDRRNDAYSPNFSEFNNYYAENYGDNSQLESQSSYSSVDAVKNYESQSEWLGLTHPDNLN